MADPVISNIPSSVPADQAAFFMSVKRSIESLMGQTRNTDQTRAVRVFELEGFYGQFSADEASQDISQSGEVPDPPTDLVVDPTAPFVHKLTWTNPSDPLVSHIEIWASVNSQSRDVATLVGITTVTEDTRGEGGIFLHGGIIVTDNYTYWIRSVSYGAVNSVWCPPDIQGGYVVQGDDSVQDAIDKILEVLHGEITENELYEALNTRLDSHDDLIPAVSAIEGRYTVKIDTNGYVAGFGFAVDDNEEDPESEFIFLTDNFKIVTPGEIPQIPFAIGEVNGSTVVGIRGDLVLDGTMLGAAIQAGTITSDRLNTQNAFIGMTIQSTNFVSGTSGWQITKDGNVQFNGGVLTVSYGNVTGTKPPSDADKTSSNTAYDTARVNGTAASTVKTNAANGATFTSSDAGSLAYRNDVSTAQLDSTIIVGGYLKTSLIEAGAIVASKLHANAISTSKIYVSDSNIAYSTFRSYFTTAASSNTMGVYNTYSGTSRKAIYASCSGSGSNSMAIHGYCPDAIGIYGQGETGVKGYSPSGSAITGSTGNSGDYWGFETAEKAYIGGGVSPFTGSHFGFSLTGNLMIGDIVITEDSILTDVNDAQMFVIESTQAQDQRVAGIISNVIKGYTATDSDFYKTIVKNPKVFDAVPINERTITHTKDNPNVGIKKGDKKQVNDGYTYVMKSKFTKQTKNKKGHPQSLGEVIDSGKYLAVEINAVGEGGINVCSEGGDIKIGDYICSSNVPGKGMKQPDDLLHNYTVAKALESVTWAAETQSIKMIACTYHCG
jgi:hypothetical protein